MKGSNARTDKVKNLVGLLKFSSILQGSEDKGSENSYKATTPHDEIGQHTFPMDRESWITLGISLWNVSPSPNSLCALENCIKSTT